MVTRNAANTYITADTSNQVLMPAQPAFLAQLASADNDITGDGTAFQLGSGNAFTEIFDQNADFNTNGTFTAPVTGKYALYFFSTISGYDGTQTSEIYTLTTSNGTYRLFQVNPTNFKSAANYISYMGSGPLADMDATDTATITVTDSGGNKVVDVGENSYFAGVLIC